MPRWRGNGATASTRRAYPEVDPPHTNAEAPARRVEVPLSFRGRGRYTAEIFADDPATPEDAARLLIRKAVVRRGGTLSGNLAPEGLIIRLRRD